MVDFTYQLEQWKGEDSDIALTFPAYHKEASDRKIPLDVDFNRLAEAKARGTLGCYTIRQDGALVAYTLAFLGTNLYYKTVKQVVFDLYYVLPEFRTKGLAFDLFRHAENCFKIHGFTEFYANDNMKFGKFLRRLGYMKFNGQYRKQV